jgi:hypothetical protein
MVLNISIHALFKSFHDIIRVLAFPVSNLLKSYAHEDEDDDDIIFKMIIESERK